MKNNYLKARDSDINLKSGKANGGIMIKIVSETVRDEEGRVIEDAVGRCTCGTLVELGSFTCTCDRCGKDYNWAGQELAPRECWGSGTNEYLSDILMIK